MKGPAELNRNDSLIFPLDNATKLRVRPQPGHGMFRIMRLMQVSGSWMRTWEKGMGASSPPTDDSCSTKDPRRAPTASNRIKKCSKRSAFGSREPP